MTEKESLKEKLLEASGLQQETPSSPDKVEQMERLFKSVLSELKTGRAEVRQAKDQGEKIVGDLKSYCEKVLPQQLVKAIDQAAEQGVRDSLRPLDEGIGRTVRTLDECRNRMENEPWSLLKLFVIAGILMGLVAGLLMRYTGVGNQAEEAKRYEVWGRKIEQRIESYPPKAKEQMYRWAGGRP